MRRLIGLIGLAAVAGASLAATSVPAAASSVPSATGVVIHPIAPSNLAPSRAFEEQIVEANPSPTNCGFYLYRNAAPVGPNVFSYRGFFKGTQTIDRLPPLTVPGILGYIGYVQYRLLPTDCAGNVGSPVYSTAVIPVVSDDSTSPAPLFSAVSGSATTVYSASYYGGSALQTTSTGADVRVSLDTFWNFGIVVGTGPRGGVGTVLVNGVKKGTINFYSPKVGGGKVSFTALGLDPFVVSVIDIVATAPGHGGGSSMYFDAGIGNYFID